MIQLEHLNKTYDGAAGAAHHALSDVSLTIEDGDVFGIIGASGAGKSTLVRCINLLERPTAGRVVIDGADVTNLKGKELLRLRASIGMIFQNFSLFQQRTVLGNVMFPLELRREKRDAAERRARELLELVELGDKVDRYPSQLSGGQQQRVAIARALVGEPRIILADEPTGALDSHTSVEIMELFKSLHREGQTVILITHNPDLAEQAERVVRIADGRLGASEHGHEGVRLAVCDTAGGNDAAPATAVARAAAEREGEAHATRANG